MNNFESTGAKTEEKIDFFSGNPTVEITEGIIHIYKNQREVPRCDTVVTSTMLCFFCVPSHITVKDLLVFISPMRGTEDRCCISNQRFTRVTVVSVCLERLDEPVQGILTTILCNHTFHDGCISRVEDTICPVCRYVQSPEMLADGQCADCDIRENLWICLICGRVGCGRYGQKHAQLHFEETGHTFALELGKTLVWDYADDAYVHRLAVNHEDGKLVQLGAKEVEARAEAALSAARAAEEKLSEVIKENGICSRKLQQATALAQRLQKDLEEERALNKSLLLNEKTWRERTEQAESEAKTAREECRELLLNLELRDKLTELGTTEELTKDEIENCEISIQPGNSQKSRRRRGKR
ncbi:unnamed protein product [Heterobilharzia americana]|nr:unnamed protein product [Heterobilharzia americana]